MLTQVDSHPIAEKLLAGEASFGGTECGRRYVAMHGRSYMPTPLRWTMRRGDPRDCYAHCAEFVIKRRFRSRPFKYVEGFAMRPSLGVVMAHAWVTRDGEAYDMTWRDFSGKKNLDCFYFGVEFDAEAVDQISSERGRYGLLHPVDDLVHVARGTYKELVEIETAA